MNKFQEGALLRFGYEETHLDTLKTFLPKIPVEEYLDKAVVSYATLQQCPVLFHRTDGLPPEQGTCDVRHIEIKGQMTLKGVLNTLSRCGKVVTRPAEGFSSFMELGIWMHHMAFANFGEVTSLLRLPDNTLVGTNPRYYFIKKNSTNQMFWCFQPKRIVIYHPTQEEILQYLSD